MLTYQQEEMQRHAKEQLLDAIRHFMQCHPGLDPDEVTDVTDKLIATVEEEMHGSLDAG